jgi:hypothetical protein
LRHDIPWCNCQSSRTKATQTNLVVSWRDTFVRSLSLAWFVDKNDSGSIHVTLFGITFMVYESSRKHGENVEPWCSCAEKDGQNSKEEP